MATAKVTAHSPTPARKHSKQASEVSPTKPAKRFIELPDGIKDTPVASLFRPGFGIADVQCLPFVRNRTAEEKEASGPVRTFWSCPGEQEYVAECNVGTLYAAVYLIFLGANPHHDTSLPAIVSTWLAGGEVTLSALCPSSIGTLSRSPNKRRRLRSRTTPFAMSAWP